MARRNPKSFIPDTIGLLCKQFKVFLLYKSNESVRELDAINKKKVLLTSILLRSGGKRGRWFFIGKYSLFSYDFRSEFPLLMIPERDTLAKSVKNTGRKPSGWNFPHKNRVPVRVVELDAN